ncbi:hypothetical protein NPIL_54931 [Nephila pilipes]|uniref:Uncharacterized protein n=1 Tax=Nephila pilipes TaxID=299642 RepID=A0A8X6UIB4_NEPPI|nr:hypothetical protein NPIL_54931 [Nephila pilipes]
METENLCRDNINGGTVLTASHSFRLINLSPPILPAFREGIRFPGREPEVIANLIPFPTRRLIPRFKPPIKGVLNKSNLRLNKSRMAPPNWQQVEAVVCDRKHRRHHISLPSVPLPDRLA